MMKRRQGSKKLDSSARAHNAARRSALDGSLPIVDDKVATRIGRLAIPAEQLRWHCDPATFDFRTTREVNAAKSAFLGQRKAIQTLKMGLSLDSPGYNLFLCGLDGSHKIQQVEELLRRIVRIPQAVPDRVYVHNFSDPQRPRLLELPAGQGYRLESAIHRLINEIQSLLESAPVSRWKRLLDKLVDAELAKIEKRLPESEEWLACWRRSLHRGVRSIPAEDFEVNALGQPARRRGAGGVVLETNPTHANLFGWIGRRSIGEQTPTPHFTEIHRGSFLEADESVLLLDANDVLSSPGTWQTLKTCLKYGALEIQDGDPSSPSRPGGLKPEPIHTKVKVILVGDYPLYDYLFEVDPDFADLFKIRVDFESETALTSRVLKTEYPAFISRVCEEEELLPVSSRGVARVLEEAVRQAGRRKKVSIENSFVADLLREANYWAVASNRRQISDREIKRASCEAIERVNQLEKKIAEMIADGTILISMSGARVGQVNGLAIYDMGDYFFGKPSRLTCETSVGQSGIINIERESGFSGRSHDKGVQILTGYLRSCFAQSRPMSLTASVCFEQSYSGIDGDSASAAEIYAILSSLSGLPVRQDIAITGSLSQKGDIQPIGGVNEKIEGFFDCVQAAKSLHPAGVIIPRKNVEDLMLREDVVAAVEKGRFHIYAIDAVEQGVEILMGAPAGKRRKNGKYPPGSVFRRVDDRLEKLANDLRRYEE